MLPGVGSNILTPGVGAALVLASSLVVMGCTPPSTLAPAAINGPATASEAAPRSAAQDAPVALVGSLPTPAAFVSLDERLLATIDIDEHPRSTANMVGNYPDEIVMVQGKIWTRTSNGHVVQVDPASNEMIGAVKVDVTQNVDNDCRGLGTDGHSVWSCSARDDGDDSTIDVVRVDPQAQAVVETFAVGKHYDQFEMPFLADHIWVLADDGHKLIGINVRTHQLGPPIELGARCFQLTAAADSLLASCASDDVVLRIDPRTREVTARAPVDNPHEIAASREGVWVVQDDAVLRLDLDDLSPVFAFTDWPGVGWDADLHAADDAVWLRKENGFLYRIDPASNKLAEQILPEKAFTEGSVLATADSVWLTAQDEQVLIRLRRE